ncbi:hypothetical protein GCM10027514_40250 [Azotobacter armeniacus]
MSVNSVFLLVLAGCVLFALGLYVERLTRPHAAEAEVKPELRRIAG